MKLAIFGGTGQTGRCLLEQAPARGHAAVVLARNAARLAPPPRGVTVLEGQVGDAAAVARTVAGADAVISVLGPVRGQAPYAVSQGMDKIITAMRDHGVQRLIVTAGAGVRDPLDKPSGGHAVFGLLVKVLARPVYEDMARMVETVRASDRAWTVVRVPRLVDGPATGRLTVGYVNSALGTSLTRPDLAAFVLGQLTDETWLRKAPAVSNA